jgi:two-component system sensor histidine kinase TctE
VVLTDPAPAEMQPLVSAINELLARAAQGQRAQQRFLANAAHQLRTPVATLQVQIERALREQDDGGRTTALRHVDDAIKRLGHLLHQLLTLAKLEPDGQSTIAPEACDLVALAKDSVERFVDRALSCDCDLGYSGPDGTVRAHAAPILVHEMLVNLLENACQYAPGGHVTVSVADDPPRLIVEDDGPGIPAAERERVWDRFYRIPESAGFGCGLGLPIVQEMARLQGATVSLDAAGEHGGTRVVITFAR